MAFRMYYGYFEYRVILFKLVNTLVTFQACINYFLIELVDIICVVYMNDILIYSDNERVHQWHVGVILRRLCRYGLYTKLSKCNFNIITIEFLGFILQPGEVVIEYSQI